MPTFCLRFRPNNDDDNTLNNCLPYCVDESEISDRVTVMRLQEGSKTYKCYDYMATNQRILQRFEATCINETCSRVAMCEWCYQIVDLYDIPREIVARAFSYLDRYLCTKRGRHVLCDCKVYQLAVMTCLYMAIKLHEVVMINLDAFQTLSGGSYRKQEFEMMEDSILTALQWRLNGPVPIDYIRYYMALMHTSVSASSSRAVTNEIMVHAQYQCEVAVSMYSLVGCQPSEIAMIALIDALSKVNRDKSLPPKTKGTFIRTVERISGVIARDALEVKPTLSALLDHDVQFFDSEDETFDSEDGTTSASCQPIVWPTVAPTISSDPSCMPSMTPTNSTFDSLDTNNVTTEIDNKKLQHTRDELLSSSLHHPSPVSVALNEQDSYN